MELKLFEWVVDLSEDYRQAQTKAHIEIHYEMYSFFLRFGKEIINSPFKKEYGDKLYDMLSRELNKPSSNRIFTPFNIKNIERFSLLYGEEVEKDDQLLKSLSRLPWDYHVNIILASELNTTKAIFYVNKTIENSWSSEQLARNIASNLYENAA